MPRQTCFKEIKSLKELCLEYVVKAVDDWINKLVVEVTDSGSSTIELLEKGDDDKLNKHVKTLLNVLPSTLWLDITKPRPYRFDHSKGNRLLWSYLYMFFSERIVLQEPIASKVEGFLQVATKRCPLLKKLKIASPSTAVKSFNLRPYLQKFQKLQELLINNSNIGDSCLEIIGTFCKDLRKLDVSHCSKVTDAGITALCVSVDHLGNKNEALGQCKSIFMLWTEGTQVTVRGIQVALRNLPYLQYWDVVTIETLIEVHKQDFLSKEVVEIPKYSFNILHWNSDFWNQQNGSPYISGSLKMVLSFCPFLSGVHITAIDGLKDADLLCVIYVERLCELTIEGGGYSTGNEITFDGGVVPLLTAKGRNLDTLSLERLQTPINIGTVTELCPNLQALFLDNNHEYITSTWNSSQPKRFKFEIPKLKNLSKIYLSCVLCPIPSVNLTFLLSSSSLIEIIISDCETLTDDVLLTAAKVNPFPNLEELILMHCDFITKKGVDIFIEENPIKKISLWFCEQITDDNIVEWKSKAVEKNWDLELDYSNWD